MSKMLVIGVSWLALCSAAAPALGAADVRANDDFARRATWTVKAPQEIREAALGWLESRQVDAGGRAQVEALWASAAEEASHAYLLDLVVATLSAGDPQARRLAEHCAQPRALVALPDVSWLADETIAPFERDHLRLLYGQWLVRETLYDEALEQLKDLKPEDVADPAALLFYQGVVHHRLLDREAGLAAIARLLENEAQLPKRYASVARLMQADLEGLKDESLDHIARRMEDVRRRLDLGRAGPKVRSVEDGVIASLDKLIEEMEKQQQAAAAAAARARGQGRLQPMAPLPDSLPMELKGPGDVAKKPIGSQSGWGDLPPRERQEALQQISKEFPAHYRDMIEQYFRRLASEDAESRDK
jgi:hypothetical protein